MIQGVPYKMFNKKIRSHYGVIVNASVGDRFLNIPTDPPQHANEIVWFPYLGGVTNSISHYMINPKLKP